MTDNNTGLALLRKPFEAHHISYLPKGGVKLAYVGHAALTDRLLDADPAWTWEPLAMSEHGLPVMDDMGGMWIKLTVCGVTRLGYGHAGSKTGGDAIKEVIGDALRNAGMRFGAALDLWHKGELHKDEPEPKAGVIKSTDGAENAVAADRRAELDEMALYMIEAHRAGSDMDAIRLYYELTDNDEKVYIWKCLGAESKLRAAIKANSPEKLKQAA